MSTLYHTSYSSLVLNAPAGPEKTLSVLVLYFSKNIFNYSILQFYMFLTRLTILKPNFCRSLVVNLRKNHVFELHKAWDLWLSRNKQGLFE